MTVAKLIEELKKYDMDCEIETISTDTVNEINCIIAGVTDLATMFPDLLRIYGKNKVLLLCDDAAWASIDQ